MLSMLDSPHLMSKVLLEFRLRAPPKGAFFEQSAPDLLRRFWNCGEFQVQAKFSVGKSQTLILHCHENSILATLRLHSDNSNYLLTLDVEYPKNSGITTSYVLQQFIDQVNTALSDADDNLIHPNWQQMPILKLGNKFNQYLTTSDDRIVEYGYRSLLFERQSPYQFVQIVDTVDHGKMLLLDGLVNLAESDTITYTHKLMGLPELAPCYKDAKILILGGGDGSLLKELMELPSETRPAFVTMVDIDALVMDACAEHMPSVCGRYLKDKEGNNFKVIAGDAFVEMDKMKAKGQKFDMIFGDLTDTPVLNEEVEKQSDPGLGNTDDVWRFLRRVLESAMDLLEPENGRYLTHCNGKSVTACLAAYERMLQGLMGGQGVNFKQRESFVSSFMEKWIFYELTLKK